MRALELSIVLLALAAGCTPERRPGTPAGADTLAARDSAASPAAAPAPAATAPWAVTPAGAGPARVGMTVAELRPLLATGQDTGSIAEDCSYVRVTGAPDGLRFMVEGGRLVRIEVGAGGTPTAEGAAVGDPESKILSLYPGARRQPQKYTDGSYLVVLPGAPGDTLSRYVFESDGERITAYRAGLYPPVEYVEGCS